MKWHPILFSGPMIRALLAGRKTQTRRVVANQPSPLVSWAAISPTDPNYGRVYPGTWAFGGSCGAGWMENVITPIYGEAGDRLWVRESFAGPDHIGNGDQGVVGFGIEYKADGEFRAHGDCGCEGPCSGVLIAHPWKPSIHMPRWASRISLELTVVRVERLQAISARDAIAEGTTCEHGFDYCTRGCGDPVSRYVKLWDALNAKRGYGWGVNPWVWAIEFKRLEASRAAA